MHPILFTSHFVTLYSYGFFVALAMLAAYFLANHNAKRYGLSQNLVTDILFLLFVAGVIGARMAYVLENLEDYRGGWLKVFAVQEGGLVWYGGFILAVMTTVFYAARQRASIWKLCDFFAPILAMGHAIGRIGCFMNGCCYGRPTRSALGVKFPGELVPRHPTQLYESAFLFTLSMVLFYLASKKHREGEIFLSYLILYSIGRFLIEFLRGDNEAFIYLTVPQWTSVFLFLGSVFFLWSLRKNR